MISKTNRTNRWMPMLAIAAMGVGLVSNGSGATKVTRAVHNDFDGDGKTDLAVYEETSGMLYICKSSSGFSQTVSGRIGGIGELAFMGDYDGDRKADPVVYNYQTYTWTQYLSGSGYAPRSFAFGAAGYAPVEIDYDGDGKDDVAVYSDTTGIWGIQQSAHSNALAIVTFGGTYQGAPCRAIESDFDGDRKADPAVLHEDSATVAFEKSASSYALAAYQVDPAGFRKTKVQGDFDGDGKSDIVLYKEEIGKWYFILSSQNFSSAATLYFAGRWNEPVEGDFDGDGKGDPTVYSQASGEWQILLSRSGYAKSTVTFGGYGATLLSSYPMNNLSAFWEGRDSDGVKALNLSQNGSTISGDGSFASARGTVSGTYDGHVFQFTYYYDAGGAASGEALVTGNSMTGTLGGSPFILTITASPDEQDSPDHAAEKLEADLPHM